MRIDPNADANDEFNKIKPKNVTRGRKLFAPIGLTYTKSRKGTMKMVLYCLVLHDFENDNNEGIIHREQFWLTNSRYCTAKIANWARAMRATKPFDAEVQDDVEDIICNGECFVGSVEIETGQWRKSFIAGFAQPTEFIKDGKLTLNKEMQEAILEAEQKRFPAFMKWALQNGFEFINPKEERERQEKMSEFERSIHEANDPDNEYY